MHCSLDHYVEHLTPEKFLWATLPKLSMAVLLGAELAVVVGGSIAHVVSQELWIFGIIALVGVVGAPVNYLLGRRWRLAHFSKLEGRRLRSSELDEVSEEARTSAFLALFGEVARSVLLELVSIETRYAEQLLQHTDRIAVRFPGLLAQMGLLFAGAALAAAGRLSMELQAQILILGASVIVLLPGFILMGAAIPSRRKHIIGYLALLGRAKRRLELEAALKATEEPNEGTVAVEPQGPSLVAAG